MDGFSIVSILYRAVSIKRGIATKGIFPFKNASTAASFAAFKIAGAKYLMMSLWQVPDEETKEFMISFYKNWLIKKHSIPNACRKTQQEMRNRFEDPYKWAGFVLVE